MLKFCVLGSDISYTLSPLIHKTVFRSLGVDADYIIEDIPTSLFAENIGRLRDTYDGFNLTKPHKLSIVLHLSAKHTKLDAVNVVKCDQKSWIGYNTDIGGFVSDLSLFAGNIKGRRVLVLGAGGAAEAVVCGLAAEGAQVMVTNRTHAKAQALAEKFGVQAKCGFEELKPEILINCTSVGNNGESALPPDLDISALNCAYDLVYSPKNTAFMAECARAGAKVSNGLGMLIRQAILADEIFLGHELDRDGLYAELEKTLYKELS